MAIAALDTMGKSEYFMQEAFDKLFEQVDSENLGMITIDQMA